MQKEKLRGLRQYVPQEDPLVLAVWNRHRYEPVPLDGSEGCRDQHHLVDVRFHRYEDAKGNLWALRCPGSLSDDERTRVVKRSDFSSAMASRAQERLTDAARKRLEEKTEARKGWQRVFLALIFLASSALYAQPTPAALNADPPPDICTGPYFYQRACDTTWFAGWPGKLNAGQTAQTCSAHTWTVAGEDGKWYPIIDQGPSGQGYRRGPAAAPAPQASWDSCFLPPHAFPGGPTYPCATAIPPPGVLNYVMKTLSQVPDPPRSSFAALYGCNAPTPTPTPTPAPSPNPYAAWIERLFFEGITGGCGNGNYCPNAYVTRAQMAVFLLKTKYGSSYVPPPCIGVFNDVPCATPTPTPTP